MSRQTRLFIPGMPQLVLQRGNNRNQVFADESDFHQYRLHLRESARESGVYLHAYVLMPNHTHLLLTAPDAGALGNMMQRLGRRYVRWFNDRHGRSGTIWEGRYRSTVMEAGSWLLRVSRYVELNPLRSRIVESPELYPWSSCRHHLGLDSDPLVSDHEQYWALGNTPFERQAAYRGLIEMTQPADELEQIRYAGHSGWLLGQAPVSVGAQNARRLAPLPKGRPRKY